MFTAFCLRNREQDLKQIVESLILDVKFEKPFCLYEAIESYSLEEPSYFSGNSMNTVIEVTIPYCLALPQSSSAKVHIIEKNIYTIVNCYSFFSPS